MKRVSHKDSPGTANTAEEVRDRVSASARPGNLGYHRVLSKQALFTFRWKNYPKGEVMIHVRSMFILLLNTAVLPAIIFIASAAPHAPAQQARANGSWLDRPLASWNRTARGLPVPPRPAARRRDATDDRRCRAQVRPPVDAAERALVRRGWRLYGATQSYGRTRIITALSGFDGMCRPAGYQAFVYWEGRYAGTLSPVLMDSRADGSLIDIALASETDAVAEFARYTNEDALCCPSRQSTVIYTLKRDDVPDFVPTNVETAATCRADAQQSGTEAEGAASLYGKRWVLTEIAGRRLSASTPYIEFDRERRQATGDAGCNRFFGGFETSGATLRFPALASTKRACPGEPNVERLEADFLRLLQGVSRYEVQSGTLRLFAGGAATLVFSADAGDGAKTASVTGTVAYLQRIALAPDARIKVELVDVSRPGATTVLAGQMIEAAGRQVPFRFDLAYDPNRIAAPRRYEVRASIYEDGVLRFTNRRAYPVLTNGNPQSVNVIVDAVP